MSKVQMAVAVVQFLQRS